MQTRQDDPALGIFTDRDSTPICKWSRFWNE
jgi:hypothetical protein